MQRQRIDFSQCTNSDEMVDIIYEYTEDMIELTSGFTSVLLGAKITIFDSINVCPGSGFKPFIDFGMGFDFYEIFDNLLSKDEWLVFLNQRKFDLNEMDRIL